MAYIFVLGMDNVPADENAVTCRAKITHCFTAEAFCSATDYKLDHIWPWHSVFDSIFDSRFLLLIEFGGLLLTTPLIVIELTFKTRAPWVRGPWIWNGSGIKLKDKIGVIFEFSLETSLRVYTTSYVMRQMYFWIYTCEDASLPKFVFHSPTLIFRYKLNLKTQCYFVVIFDH